MRRIKKGDYYVYDTGLVTNLDETPVESYVDNFGYEYVMVPGPQRANRFVYEVWCGRIPEGYQIDHVNNDRADNRPMNLTAVTASENSRMARANNKVDRTMKAVGIYDKDGTLLATYKSATEAERITKNTIKFSHQRLSECMDGTKATHRGYIAARVDLDETGYNPNEFKNRIWNSKMQMFAAF